MPGRDDDRPIIMTAQLDETAQAHFDALRRQHYPRELNRTPAHLTLFHNLPGDQFDSVLAQSAAIAASVAPVAATTAGLRRLGRGVAFEIDSASLIDIRRRLADAFAPILSGQDRQPFKPHITVQNKAAAGAAERLFQSLRHEFAPLEMTIEGLQLWRYNAAGVERGRWTPAGAIAFGGQA